MPARRTSISRRRVVERMQTKGRSIGRRGALSQAHRKAHAQTRLPLAQATLDAAGAYAKQHVVEQFGTPVAVNWERSARITNFYAGS